MEIRIGMGQLRMEAERHDPPTGQQIAMALPMQTLLKTWGNEISGAIPVASALADNAREVVEWGELG